VPVSALEFLRRCQIFVNEDWQHADRDPSLPDQGFERLFRVDCTLRFGARGWRISQPREMSLGLGLETASGVLHEIDLVAQHPEVTAILELKNRAAFPPGKNDVIVFHAKLLDYFCLNPALLLKEICPVFLSAAPLEATGLAACLGLGINPVAPGLRPLPVLVDNARRMAVELERGLPVPPDVQDAFAEFCPHSNQVSLALEGTWFSNRYGYSSETTIIVKAVPAIESIALAEEYRRLNSDCSRLLCDFKAVKGTCRR